MSELYISETQKRIFVLGLVVVVRDQLVSSLS